MRWIALLVLGSGCLATSPVSEDDAATAAKNIRYVREETKHLCFAVVGSYSYGFVKTIAISAVPNEVCYWPDSSRGEPR